MAVALTTHYPTTAGIPSTTAAFVATVDTTGFTFRNTPDTILILRNTHTSNITAVAVTPGTVEGLAIADMNITLVTATDRYIRLPAVFNDDEGFVTITFSSFGTGSAANVLALVLATR